VIAAELALTKTFLDLLVGRDVYEEPRVVADVAAVLMDTDEDEAPFIPAAFAAALRAVSSDLGRWRAAAEAAVQLDLFECVDDLVAGLERLADPHQIGNTALLIANPAVPAARREVLARRLMAFLSSETLQTQLEVRLGLVRPETAPEHVLDSQVWPGRHSAAELSRFAPVVYVAAEGAPPADYWRVLGALVEAGARVRRLQATVEDLPQPDWATEHAPLVCWSGKAIFQWKNLTRFDENRVVMAPASLESKLALPRLINDVQSNFPPGWALRPLRETQSAADESLAFSVETLREGGFDHLEMMYLGAAGRSVLQNLARDVLIPKDDDRQRWTFDQLVTLRLVQGFKVYRRTRADAKKVFERLHDIATANTTSAVAYDANGNVYIDEGDGFRTLDGNQEALGEVLKVDVAFRPFKLGGGLVPDLLHPSVRTRVDPRVLGGTPTVRGRRISARALNDVYALRGEDATRSAFPELEPAAIFDAVRVGREITKNRTISK
jgi:uncharacterized protein (DUF433 family)